MQGVSTRKVADITEALCGTSFSRSLVSTLAGQMDQELEASLTAQAYPYLWVDARYEDVRVGSRIISQGVLIVTGVSSDGKRDTGSGCG